jgi:hypothetical protein
LIMQAQMLQTMQQTMANMPHNHSLDSIALNNPCPIS